MKLSSIVDSLKLNYSASQSNPVRIIHYASGAIIGIYAVSICYKTGLLARILPPKPYKAIERVVEKAKEKTKPVFSTASRLTLLQRHLFKTYGWTALGMTLTTAGAIGFVQNPRIPLAPFLVAALFCGLVLGSVPKNAMTPLGRKGLFLSCWLSGGYTIGPIVWVAQDRMSLYALVSSSSLVGVSIALLLTRGVVSYLVSSQALSFALSLFVATSSTSTATIFGLFKSHPGLQHILHSDLTSLVLMQFVSNAVLLGVHTIPRIRQYVNMKKSVAELVEAEDALWDAHALCAGWVYAMYCLVRKGFFKVLKMTASKNSHTHSSRFDLEEAKTFNAISSVSSAVIMVVMYVQLVAHLQRGDVNASLNHMRHLFQQISPKAVQSR